MFGSKFVREPSRRIELWTMTFGIIFFIQLDFLLLNRNQWFAETLPVRVSQSYIGNRSRRSFHKGLKGEITYLRQDATMHNEDRELVVKLALLQTDVQLYSNILIGFIALAFSVIVGFEQVYFAYGSELFLLPVFIMPAVLLVALVYLVNKIDQKKNEIKKLKKEYVW